MDELLQALAKGLIKNLELNEEIEDNFNKIINIKLKDIAAIIQNKGFPVSEAEVKEKLVLYGEQILINFLESNLKNYIVEFFNYSIWEIYRTGGLVKGNSIAYAEQYLKKQLENKVTRKNYYTILSLLTSDIIERYTKTLFSRKGYGKLYLFAKPINAPKLLEEFIKFSTFFYPIGNEGVKINNKKHFIEEYSTSPESFNEFTQMLSSFIQSNFDKIPEPVYRTGFDAAINKNKLNYEMDFNIRADLLRILVFLAKFKKKQALPKNKRADTPEKSLISLFQKQTEFLGLDKNLLHDLEFISRENKW